MSGPDYLDRLARLACSVRFEALSGATVAAAKAVVLDTIGAILAGSALDENRNLAGLAVWFLVGYLRKRSLTPFVIYRLLLSLAILLAIR